MADGTTISAKIANIQSSADTIKTWLNRANITVASPQKLANSAAAISAIPIKTDIAATAETPQNVIEIGEGVLFKVEPGYYPSALYIKNINEAAEGEYDLYALGTIDPTQAKTYRPSDYNTSSVQYYGFNTFTVGALPPQYVDTTPPPGYDWIHLATSDQVLDGYYAGVMGESGDSTLAFGTMPDNGAAGFVLNTDTKSYTIPEGYHNGSGVVSIETEEKSVTPALTSQNITPSTGKVLSKVTVGAIPNQKTAVTATLDANETYIEIPAGYYTSPSRVSINATEVTASLDLTGATSLPQQSEHSWAENDLFTVEAPNTQVYTSLTVTGPVSITDLRLTAAYSGLIDSNGNFSTSNNVAETWGTEAPFGSSYLSKDMLAEYIPEGVCVGFAGTAPNSDMTELTWDDSMSDCFVNGRMQNKGVPSYDVMSAERSGFIGEGGYYQQIIVNTAALYDELEKI